VRRVLLSGSILDADFSDLGHQVREAVEGGVDLLHFDIADTSFTPTISFGPRVVASVAKSAGVPGEAHLMVGEPEPIARQLVGSGVSRVYFHVEASRTPFRTLQALSDMGFEPGVALNPATRVESVEPLLPHARAVLVLLVEPGLGGQRMIRGALSKVAALRSLREREGYSYLIAVDGGVKPENVAEVVAAGADIVVAGSAIFASGDPRGAAGELKRRILAALSNQPGGAPLDP
jgi:ribulose-phosphate 3-epimerase